MLKRSTSMTLRERVLSVLNGKKPDKLPWLGDLDYWISYLNLSGKMPDKYQGEGIFKLHRDLGVGFYLQGYFPLKTTYQKVEKFETIDGNLRVTRIDTPVGSVREVWQYLPDSFTWGPQEHFVKSEVDLKVIRYWYEHTCYQPDYEMARKRYQLIGDNGIVLCYQPKSPLMEMVALLAGIETVTYCMLDNPEEFDETLAVLEQKADEAAAIVLESPAEGVMIPENLSSEVVGKNLFKKYMRNYLEKWNRRIKAAGKYSFVHMDGTLKGLINEVSATGFTVLEALTPGPVGDIDMNEMKDWVGKETVIWGGIPGLYFTDIINDADFDRFVINIIENMKSEPRYVLGVADQVPPGARWERIKRVSELVEIYGKY